jgi:hypothetical protein
MAISTIRVRNVVLTFAAMVACWLAGAAAAQTIVYPLNQANPTVGPPVLTSGGAANCNRGYAFQVNAANKAIYKLGCFYPDGATQVKTLTLWKVTSAAPAISAGTVEVQVNSVPGPGWCWTTLATPYPLIQGERYIVEGFTTTTSYYFGGAFTPPSIWLPGVGVTPAPDILYLGMYYNAGPTASTFPTSLLSNYIYGIVDIGYGDNSVAGDSLWVKDFGVVQTAATPGLPAVASNVLRVTLRNGGSTTLNGPVTLEYSTDNGATFPANQSQSITLTALAMGNEINVDLTTAAPWVLATTGNFTVVVRESAATAIGTTNITKTNNFRPDADITAAAAGAAGPIVGSNTVAVTVKNNGTFNLNGTPLPLRYSIDAGANWVTQNFTPTTLSANGGTETFTFTTPWVLAVGGAYNLTAAINPPLTGDPDTTDTYTQAYPEAGVPGILVNYVPQTTLTTGLAYPMSSTYVSAKMQNTNLPADVGGLPCYITHMGFSFSTAGTFTWGTCRIEIGETTLTTLVSGSNFNTNYNVPASPKTTVYDGPLTVVTTTVGQFWRVALPAPFYYAAVNKLLITVYCTGNTAAIGANRNYNTGQTGREMLYTLSAGDAANGTSLGSGYGFNTSFRIIQSVTTGAALFPVSCGVPAGAVVGPSNLVGVSVRNMGNAAQTAAFPMQYSIDNGTTWSAAQSFTPTTLGVQGIETFTFTAPWAITTFGLNNVQVRINPAVGGLPQTVSGGVRPDADITVVNTGASDPVIGPNTVQVTVKNNGGFSLNGISIPLRYIYTPGGSYVTQTFTGGAALAANGGTQTFSFTTPWTLTTGGAYTLAADISPPLTGDPDATDSLSIFYSEAGVPGTVVNFQPVTGANAIPWSSSYTNSKYQCSYNPADIGGQSCQITQIGFYFSSVLASATTWPSVRIALGETSLTTLTATYDANYNVTAAPKTVVFNGPMTITAPTVGTPWRVTLTTPYQYSATNKLLVEIYTVGSPVAVSQYATTLAGYERVYSTSAGDVATGTVGASYGTSASFRILQQVQGSSLWVQDVTIPAPGMAVAGAPNTIRVALKNGGTVDLSSTQFTLQYSTDGGTTFPNSQNFTLPSFAALANATVDFTTQWTPATLANYAVVVKVNPAIGTVNTQKTVVFRPDLDITVANTGAQEPQIGPNTVQVTVKNNGSFSLSGVSIPLRYTVDAGTNYTVETFTGGAALATALGTQTFSFTTPFSLAAAAPVTLTASVNPVLSGDPDTTDSLTSSFPFAGLPGANQIVGNGTTGNGIPFASTYTSCKYATAYTAAELGGQPCLITHIGFPFSAALAVSWTTWRIELGETTLATLGATYDSNYNVTAAPKTIVFNGPATVTTTAIGQVWLQALTTPYFYAGVNKLCVTMFVQGATAAASVQYASVAGYERVYVTSTTAATSADVASGTVGASFKTNAVVRIVSQVTGSAFLMMGASVSGGAPTVGNNTVTGTLRNMGTVDYTNTPFTMEYSTDGGTTWPVSQNFTPTTFIPLSQQVFSFTTPWNLAAPGTVSIKVRVNPPVGTAFTQLGGSAWSNDTDLTAINTVPVAPLAFSANTMTVTVKNNGTFNLTGASIPLRYSVDGGFTSVSQTFTGGAAFTAGTTQVFSFTQPWTPQIGNYLVLADIAPPGTGGDPDAYDLFSKQYNGVGSAVTTNVALSNLDIVANYARVNGQKDVYKGETIPVELTLVNNYTYAVQITSVAVVATAGTTVLPVNGVTVSQLAQPLNIAAGLSGIATVNLSVSSGSTAANDSLVTVSALMALGVDTAAPTTNPVLIAVTAAAKTFKLFNGPAPAPFFISQTLLGPATASILYFQTLSASGGSGTYTWSVAASSLNTLPTSLSLTAAGTAVAPAFITGTPLTTDAGQRSVKFDCSDGIYIATKTFTLLIQAEPLAFTPITGGLPAATEGSNYNFTLTGIGGSGSYTYSVATSSTQQLPTGMSLNASNGVLSGIPAPLAAGSYNITFRVNDGFQTADNPQTLVVNPGPLLWVGPATMSGKETVAFTGHLSAAGGVAVRSYTVATSSAQQLPTGLSLNSVTGDITGAANIGTAGTFNVTFNVTDGVTILPHTVVITIIVADPFVITTPSLPVGQATVAYTAAMAATGGSEAYSWSIVSSVPPLPASITLAAATGIFSGTPGFDDHGRYALTIKATDTANRTQTVNLILGIPQKGAPKIHLTELNVGATNYIEISHRGGDVIDLSGWNIKVWVDGTSPLALTWSALPGGTLGFPGSVIQINSGGTAGGSFPTFNTGTAFNATSASNVAVALYDASGNPIDMVVTGNIVVTALVSTGTTNAGITSEQWATNLSTGSDNYSRTAAGDNNTGADWTASATGTPGAFNPALLAPVLDFAIDAFPAAKVGVAYGRTIVAVGGVPPYTYSLVNATSTPWLSISATTGDLSGTPAAGDIGTFPVTVKVTDSTTATAQSTSNLIVLGAAESAAHSFTFSSPSLSSQANTVASVDLTLGGTATAVADFEVRFTMANPELVFTGVTKGPALSAAGASVLVWKRGDTYTVAGFYAGSGTPSAMAPGKVATLNFKVVPAGVATKATDGVTAMPVSEAVASDTQDAALSASGTAGSITLNGYKNQDVNHNNTVNVQDVQLCVNLILHTATPTYTGQGDVNKSGSVTVADVQSIVNCILNAAACTQ